MDRLKNIGMIVGLFAVIGLLAALEYWALTYHPVETITIFFVLGMVLIAYVIKVLLQ